MWHWSSWKLILQESVFLGEPEVFVGPSDVGGTCPVGTSLWTSDVAQCCCGGNCCWRNCRWHNPAENCLPPGATWRFKIDEESPDQWVHDGKIGYFQAIKTGKYFMMWFEVCLGLKWLNYILISIILTKLWFSTGLAAINFWGPLLWLKGKKKSIWWHIVRFGRLKSICSGVVAPSLSGHWSGVVTSSPSGHWSGVVTPSLSGHIWSGMVTPSPSGHIWTGMVTPSQSGHIWSGMVTKRGPVAKSHRHCLY